MRILHVLCISFILSFCSSPLFAQIPEFDRLEMLYAQGHYKMVYRKANRLLDQPEYDFSLAPTFYKSLSLFQLSQNKHWLVRHSKALEQAETLFSELRKNPDGRKLLTAHLFEVSALKKDLIAWAEDLKRLEDTDKFSEVQGLITRLFEDIPDLEEEGTPPPADPGAEKASAEREELVTFAKKFIGVPYVWGGDDPSGFDCSGFTSYVMKNSGIKLPRRAVDQYNASKKLKIKSVQKGDLVFFDNGSGISHVGMVISDKGKPVVMIHASSSKGIMISEIDNSNYWKARLYGFGTYLE